MALFPFSLKFSEIRKNTSSKIGVFHPNRKVKSGLWLRRCRCCVVRRRRNSREQVSSIVDDGAAAAPLSDQPFRCRGFGLDKVHGLKEAAAHYCLAAD